MDMGVTMGKSHLYMIGGASPQDFSLRPSLPAFISTTSAALELGVLDESCDLFGLVPAALLLLHLDYLLHLHLLPRSRRRCRLAERTVDARRVVTKEEEEGALRGMRRSPVRRRGRGWGRSVELG